MDTTESATAKDADAHAHSRLPALRRFARENSLSLFFLIAFLVTVAGQSVAGHLDFNAQEAQHGGEPTSYGRYLISSSFGEALLENWQSEFLQFTFFILATVWLVQRGSPESKPLEEVGQETKKQQQIGSAAAADSPGWARLGGWRTAVYSNSLLLLMGLIFVASILVQSVTGWNVYNDAQRQHGGAPVSWGGYVSTPDFWEKALQNWQSECLAVGAMAVFGIYLRQRGSPESKPVGASHDATGRTG
jgi:hypothetical protein